MDAEDASHDAMLTVMRKIDSLKDPDAFGSWLYGITRRTIAGHRRKAWVRRWAGGAEPPDAPDTRPDPQARAELSDRAAAVQAILERMSPKHREVLVLCVVEERTDDETAALLGVPAGTVKSRLRVARAKFADAAARRDLVDVPTDPAQGEESA